MTVLQAFVYALAAVTFGVALDFVINGVTGGSLPGPLAHYPQLAWPALGVMFVASVTAAVRERLKRHGSHGIGLPRPPPEPPPPPKELPPDIPEFTGRRRELKALWELVPAAEAAPTAPTTVTVYGVAGTGKSALAVHFAHEVQANYPDAQLYVSLMGASSRRVEPVEALGYLVRSLGAAGPDIPTDVDGLTREYARRLRGRRTLLLLDNAASEAQVRPLLPKSPTCLVVITCRNQLAGLTSSTPIRLGVMSEADAVALLVRIAGGQLLDGGNERAVAQMASLCGYLPLALSITAAQLRSRTIGDVLSSLESSRDLGVPEPVRASFDITYEHLMDWERRLFRRLRLLPEPTFGAGVAAALVGCSPRQASDALDRLADEQVLERVGNGRYGFTDFIGRYASDKLRLEEVQQEREAASAQALRFYLDEAMGQAALVDPAIHEVIGGSFSASSPASLDEQVAALDWFERERPRLVRVWRQAIEIKAHDVTWKLAAGMVPFFELRGHRADWTELQLAALESARASGELYAQVWSWLGAGHLRWLDGRLDEARHHLVEALESAGAGGWLWLRARALYLRGCVEHDAHRLDAALACYTRAAEMFGDLGLPHEQTSTVFYLAVAMHEQGGVSVEKAMHLGESALADLAGRPQELWVVRTVAGIRESLGQVAEELGDRERAGTYYIGSREAFRRIGFKHGRARVLRHLGRMRIAQESWSRAREFLDESAELFCTIGDADQEAVSRLLLAALPPDAPAAAGTAGRS